MIRRRQFLTLLGGAAAAWPVAVRAQKTAAKVVGFLHVGSAEAFPWVVTAFRQGLKETGFIEGQNVTIEFRWAEGKYDRLSALASELVRRDVAVIFAAGGSAPALAAKAATAQIPIVFSSGGDPVTGGLVSSLNRPGGTVTGVSLMFSDTVAKRLGLLHEVVPKASLIGVVVNPDYADVELQLKQLQEGTRSLSQELQIEKARTAHEIGMAFENIVRRGATGLLVANDPFFTSQRYHIVALAMRHALPVIYEQREYTLAGVLMSYGSSLVDALRQAGIYVGRILKGENPADLPVQAPTKYELAINLMTAKALASRCRRRCSPAPTR